MFDIEISRTWYLFSGPVYVSVFVTVFVSCYHRHSMIDNYKFFREVVSTKVVSNQVQVVPGRWHGVYIR